MCGIFGVVYRDRRERPPIAPLGESARRMRHRGPDATGEHAAPGVGLAHTRLSLIDVDPRSNQPFWDVTGRYSLIFNGEVYNYRELRAELEAGGVRFRTSSDTEVLLHWLIHRDPDEAIRSLEGMFAFAFCDAASGHVLLARDRFGMKPLYVYEDDRHLLFGSTISALRPWIRPDLDRFSMASYLLGFGGPTKGFTFYQRVRMVAPGDLVVCEPGQAAVTRPFFRLPQFWDDEHRAELAGLDDTAIVDRADEILQKSVAAHLLADVPVGAFCSGGVDSSIITAMAARRAPNLAIFHADMTGRWSEYQAAAALATHLKLDLKCIQVTDEDIVRMIPEVMGHYEHPFTYHPNCAPLMLVARLARESGVKGLLSGEGSDECFLGYPWLGRQRFVDAWMRAAARTRRLLSRVPGFGRVLFPEASQTPVTLRSLFNRREIDEDRDLTREMIGRTASGRVRPQDLWTLDYLGHHLRTLLHRNDTMGMAESIEARFPFLDHRLVRFAVNLPVRHKLRVSPTVLEKAHPFVRDKWIVRRVAARYMPRGLSERIKIGFWTTVFERLRVAPGYFDASFVRDLFELSASQMSATVAAADQDLLMRLLHLDVWGRVCVEERAHDSVSTRLDRFVSVRPD